MVTIHSSQYYTADSYQHDLYVIPLHQCICESNPEMMVISGSYQVRVWNEWHEDTRLMYHFPSSHMQVAQYIHVSPYRILHSSHDGIRARMVSMVRLQLIYPEGVADDDLYDLPVLSHDTCDVDSVCCLMVVMALWCHCCYRCSDRH